MWINNIFICTKHVHIHIYLHINMYINIHTHLCIYIHSCTFIYSYIEHQGLFLYPRLSMWINNIFICTKHIYIYLHINMYINIHTHLCIYIHSCTFIYSYIEHQGLFLYPRLSMWINNIFICTKHVHILYIWYTCTYIYLFIYRASRTFPFISI
jgi:hypothetical protein